MSDPAVEAAQRAVAARYGSTEYTTTIEIESAREALAPIRELHLPHTRIGYPGADGRTVCNHCLGPVVWPCRTAQLIYTTEELS